MPSSYVRFVEFDWLFRRRVLIGLAGSRVRFKCFLTFVRKKVIGLKSVSLVPFFSVDIYVSNGDDDDDDAGFGARVGVFR